ncbi:MAG TPA: phosphopantetheine-binding protein [Thermoguttaceae bacterium]|nr:phosphopantetheine-binding protein [Thermoguttaceae bacterium]
MVISSRTPEGTPNRCPICGADVKIEPSVLFGDAPCPHCGHLLWFTNVPEPRLFEHEEAPGLRRRLCERLAEILGVSADAIQGDPTFARRLDSLDVVELVMEFEETA